MGGQGLFGPRVSCGSENVEGGMRSKLSVPKGTFHVCDAPAGDKHFFFVVIFVMKQPLRGKETATVKS